MAQPLTPARFSTVLTVIVSLLVVVPGAGDPVAADPGGLELRVLGSYDGGAAGAAEIVAHHPGTQRLYVTNGAATTLDVVDISDPTAPALEAQVDTSGYGARPTSVAVSGGLVAVAHVAATVTDPGKVTLHASDGAWLQTRVVGPSPGMLTFTPDGTKLLVANEGVPNGTDPLGSISVIDVSGGVPAPAPTSLDFTAFNGLLPAGVIIDPDAPSDAADLEPEFITVSADSTTAWVTLQDNNAVAVIDLTGETITAVRALGTKDHSAAGSGLDPHDGDGVAIGNFPVQGLYMPDAIASYRVGTATYLVTANEGEVRDAAVRVEDATFDPTAFPTGPPAGLERLEIHGEYGDAGNDGDIDTLYSFGARSFSIWDAATGDLVFDSGDDFEQLIADRFPTAFNSRDPIGAGVDPVDPADDVSDLDGSSGTRGPEPEGVTVGRIGTSWYAFIGLEAQGGVMVYDVTSPASPTFVDYVQNRDLADYLLGVGTSGYLDPAVGPGDWSPEGLRFVAATDSPTGNPLLVVAHERSGTTTIFELVTVGTPPPLPAGTAPADPEAEVIRIDGLHRIDTAIELSKVAYPDGSADAVIARSDLFPDALAGGPLAAALGAPVLLNPSDVLDPRLVAELERLGVETVHLLGQTAALSANVEKALGDLGYTVVRLGGADRFETAADIAMALADLVGPPSQVFVVEGRDENPGRGWPDAMSAGWYAGIVGAPIVPVTTEVAPAASLRMVDELAPTDVVVVGGPVAVSEEVAALFVDEAAGRTVRRLSGENRYDTGGAVYDEAVANGADPRVRWFATGLNWPDALAAGAVVAAQGTTFHLIHGLEADVLDTPYDRLMAAADVLEAVALVGGPAAIDPSVEARVASVVASVDDHEQFPAADLCLTVLHNNDGESQLLHAGSGIESFGGIAHFASVVANERARAAAPAVGCTATGSITVTSGDNFLAGPEWSASQVEGVPYYDSMALDHIGYDAIDLGNHDFDFGPGQTAAFIHGFANPTPFLSANLDVAGETALLTLYNDGRIAPSTTVDVAGRTVGVIGLTTPTLRSISSPGAVVVDPDVVAAVEGEVARVSAAGADIIILISHLQGIDDDLALIGSISGVDIVVAGGGDEILASPGELLVPGDEVERYGTYPLLATDAAAVTVPVVTTAGDYKYLGRLTARIDADGTVLGWNPDSRMVRVGDPSVPYGVAGDAWLEANVEAPVAAYLADLGSSVVATSTVALDGRRETVRAQQSNVGSLLADAEVAAVRSRAAAYGLNPAAHYVAIQNGGGIRNNTVIEAGDLTVLDTFDIAPFSNFVGAFEGMTAAQVKALLEHAYGALPDAAGKFAQVAGLKVAVDPSRAAGSRVREVELIDGPEAGMKLVTAGAVVGGAPTVTVVTIDFLARGGDDYPFPDAEAGFTAVGVSYQQALEDFLGSLGTVTAAAYPRTTDPATGTRIAIG